MKRTFYGNGRIETEMYYDEEDRPIPLTMGQYGVLYEYDELGRKAVVTYLNASGLSTPQSLGCATVIRTFYSNDTVDT